MLPLFTTGNFLMLSCNCQVTCSFPWDVSALRTGIVSALFIPVSQAPPGMAWNRAQSTLPTPSPFPLVVS